MNPLRYETSNFPRRLSGRTEQQGSQVGFSTLAVFLFGTVFIGAGIPLFLVGIKLLPVNPASVHGPHWMVAAFGIVFAVPGFWMWIKAWKQHASQRRTQAALKGQPHEPAYADYQWNPRGFESQRWPRAMKAILVALLLTLFLSGFNYWALEKDSPWMLRGMISLFDVFGFVIWYRASLAIGRAFKFGDSRIVFQSFPYHLGVPIVIHWQPGSGINRANKGSFTLRCVKEWYEVTGTGKDRSRELVHEEMWSGTWHLEQPRNFQQGLKIDLQFDVPGDFDSTVFRAPRPIFWEFEVKLDLPGLDFDETYLVPIYGRVGEKIEA